MKLRYLIIPLLAAIAPAIALIGPVPDAHGLPCAGSVDEARRHMDKGLGLFDKKRFVEAAAEFDAAYTAQPFSAFLCNAAMAYQEAGDFPNAILRYKAFLRAEPNPPDLARIKSMLAWLDAQNAARIAAQAARASDDGGVDDGGAGDAGSPVAAGDAGAPRPPPSASPPVEISRVFRSQVIVQSDPPDAPLRIYARRQGAPPYESGKENPGWDKVVSGVKTPHDVSLAVGDYHIVIDAFKDYKRSETDLQLVAGHLYEFKANLSQGEFLGFLRVTSVEGAKIFLDDPPPHKKGPWGRSPYGALVDLGAHKVYIEAPGYEPWSEPIDVKHGETVEIAPALQRVGYGYVLVDGNAEEVSVKIDGVPYGAYTATGEALRIKLPAGKHRVELSASGRKTYSGDVQVHGGQEIAVHGRLSFTPPRSTAVISGVLAVGAGVGAWALIQQPARSLRGVSSDGKPTIVSTGTQPYFKIGGAVSIGVAAALAGVTIYTLVSDPTPPSRVQIGNPRDLDEPGRPAPPPPPVKRIFGLEPSIGTHCAGLVVFGAL